MNETHLPILLPLLQALSHRHSPDLQAGQLLHPALDAGKGTGKETEMQAAAKFRQKLLRRLPAKLSQISVGRVRHHQSELITEKQTDRPHAPPPTHHPMPLRFQKPCSCINLRALILPQSDEIPLPIAASPKIEAGQSDTLRQRGQEERPLKAARSVAVQVKNYVAHLLLPIEVQLERYAKGLKSEPAAQPPSRTQNLRIVQKTRRPNQHVCQLLKHSLRLVVLQLKESWLYTGFRLLLRFGRGVVECDIHG